MSKLVSFAGFSRVAGELKFRTANDVKRIDQLRKLGDTDVVILALPTDMSKQDAIAYVLSEVSSGAYMVDQTAAEALLLSLQKGEKTVRAPKAKKTVKVSVQKSKPSSVIKATVSVDSVMSAKEAERVRAEFMKKLAAVYQAS